MPRTTEDLGLHGLQQCITYDYIPRMMYIVYITLCYNVSVYSSKGKGLPQQVQGVPGRLGPRIFLTFGTTRVVGRQPYAPAAFTPGEIPGIHFQGLSRPQGTWFHRGEPRKKSPVTPPGIDPGTVAQCLNHYATPGPVYNSTTRNNNIRCCVSVSCKEIKTFPPICRHRSL